MISHMYVVTYIYTYICKKKVRKETVRDCVLEEKFYINTDMLVCRRRTTEMFSVI